jgi:arsenical pump membrane protein
LLLPISNLTNLLAQQQLSASTLEYASHMWLPAATAVTVTVVVLGLRYRRDLRGAYPIPEAPVVTDRLLFLCSAAVCLAIGPLAIAGIPVMWISVAGAVFLTSLFAARRPQRLRLDLLPWRLVVLVVGLFLLVSAAQQHGLDQLLSDSVGQGSSWASALRLAVVGGVGANIVNNLPAYAALEPVAAGAGMLYPLLISVNLGPLVLMWGSLATLLWRERCRSLKVDVSWREFALVGVVGVPLLLILTTAAEQLTR